MKTTYKPGDKVRIKIPKGIKSDRGKKRALKVLKKLLGRIVTVKGIMHPEIYPVYYFHEITSIFSEVWLAPIK